MNDRNPHPGYIPTLNGWRAIAILMVLVAHGAPVAARSLGLAESDVSGWSTRAALGVDVFFGISGFLICSRLIQERQHTNSIDLRGFYIRRFFRILPPFVVVLVVLWLLTEGGLIRVRPAEWLGSLLFYRNYVASLPGGWYTGHFWSLAIEEHFYFLWPLILYFRRPRIALSIAFVGIVAIAVWRTFAYRVPALREPFGDVSFFARTDIRMDALLFGCAAALLVARYRTLLERHASAVWTIGIITLYVWCVAKAPPFSLSWQGLLIAAAIGSTSIHPLGFVGAALEWMPLQQIGKYSYSLYLWQQLFLPPQSDIAFPWLQTMPLALVALTICAVLSYHWVEQPFIRLGQRLAKAPRNLGPASPATEPCLVEASR
ncbi:hypothetical protein F183_A28850 [Bryobacterales bacterium F-183]|nr:hypothetical protein F183_A28850 [Bryobacterales bacterium F-183]